MELRPEFLIPAIAKTLQDVVVPVLDDHQQVAKEQIGLAIGFLNILAEQMPLQYRFDADELGRLVTHVEELTAATGETEQSAQALDAAKLVLDAVGSAPDALVDQVRQLRLAASELINKGHDGAPSGNDPAISKAVDAFSKTQLARDRGWTLPMGFEDSPDAVQTLENQLS